MVEQYDTRIIYLTNSVDLFLTFKITFFFFLIYVRVFIAKKKADPLEETASHFNHPLNTVNT